MTRHTTPPSPGFLALIVFTALALSACAVSAAPPAPLPTQPPGGQPTLAAPPPGSQPGSAGDGHDAALLPTAPPEGYWIGPGVPQGLAAQIIPALHEAGLVEAPAADQAIVRVALDPGSDAALQTTWVYALAAPFPTVPDGLSWDAVRSYWLSGDLAGMGDFGSPPQLVLTGDALAILSEAIGPPAASLPLMMADSAALQALAWNTRPSLSFIPFDELTPHWKVLQVDGVSPLDRSADLTGYPLIVRVGVTTTGERGAQVAAGLSARGVWPASNRDPARMTVLVMTGVTALVRATASMMQVRGYDYPAQEILPFLADADILHTSNEVAFTPACPPPEWEGDTTFCSGIENFHLLQTIGLDVVELTGNHVNDWGTDALAYTLDLYGAYGMVYYGGGYDVQDASTPRIILAPDGTRIAFVGCNAPGPQYAFASEASPGAAPCGDWSAMIGSIQALKAGEQADVVIASVQHWEMDHYAPSSQQVADFTALAEAGADIVSGSQAHQPQGFAFAGDGFIHYGVGNLFFDQMQAIGYRQMFADRHILYEGRHISTVLFTGLIHDWSQPRPMSAQDRAAFLQLIYAESGW